MSPAEGTAQPHEAQRTAQNRLDAADRALSVGELDGASRTQLDGLAAEVIAARVAFFDSQIAGGCLPTPAEQHQLERDRQLLNEPQGQMGLLDAPMTANHIGIQRAAVNQS
jgi:hypothetical protein